jgi:mRNA-degrading endonuclease toxin of MazEF toxin-antitoxin module
VKELDVYQVDVYDPAEEPCRDRYLVYVHFDPGAHRGYSTETEFNLAGSWIAERLIRLDESESPGIISRLRFNANRVTVDVDPLKGGPYSPGAGIKLWIELSPGWSRLRNRSLVQLQILRMQSEVRAQSQTGRYSTTTQ